MNCSDPKFLRLAVSALPALVLLALVACRLNDGIVTRTQEYFPLQDSTTWTYQHEDNTTSKVYVRGDSSAYNHSCTVVEEDAAEHYWFKGDGEVRKFVSYTFDIGGTDYSLEQNYRRFLVLPLVLGNSWSEGYGAHVPILGDTVVFSDSITGQVVAIDSVRVPYGSFDQCYKVEITEQVTQDSVTTTTNAQEWYAPGIGLVKRVEGSSTEELLDYQAP